MIDIIQKVFKAIGEPTRIKIMKLIYTQPMCVCEISAALEMLQPRISQHMRILKEADLVTEQREGYFTYYSLDKQRLAQVLQSFQQFIQLPLEESIGFEEISTRLADLEKNEQVKLTKACGKGE